MESVYEEAVSIELRLRGCHSCASPSFELAYKSHALGENRLDLLVGGRLVVELLAVESLTDLPIARVIRT